MIFFILLFDKNVFCIWIGLLVLIGKNSILLCLSSFLVLFMLRIVFEFVCEDILNVICDGIFVLMIFVIMLIDGCCVVIMRWMLVVCVIWDNFVIEFFILDEVIIMRLVSLFIIIMIYGSFGCFVFFLLLVCFI